MLHLDASLHLAPVETLDGLALVSLPDLAAMKLNAIANWGFWTTKFVQTEDVRRGWCPRPLSGRMAQAWITLSLGDEREAEGGTDFVNICRLTIPRVTVT
tara:strand:+ start:107 stop:406 length:300 start_codon:yes stop_codon:yes gene_type:complete